MKPKTYSQWRKWLAKTIKRKLRAGLRVPSNMLQYWERECTRKQWRKVKRR